MALLLQNNTVETFSVKASDASKTARLTLGGHRTDVRTLAFSSDNLAVLSASGDTVKIWNRSEGQRQLRPVVSGRAMRRRSDRLVFYRSTLQVIRTMACDYALSSMFVPGDRQVIVGTKVRGFALGPLD